MLVTNNLVIRKVMKDKLIDSNQHVQKYGRAWLYATEHTLKPKHATNVVGGADSGIDQFAIIRQYQLKGFEYGNWVSNNDRYDHLIAAQRSLQHLSWIFRTQNIGINNNVGIAFGARGNGGRVAAHYEPNMNMVNLTKPHGAGCLAHEYGHALDFNLGSFVDQNKNYAALSGGHSIAQTLDENTGGQLRAMTNKLLDEINRTESTQTLRKNNVAEYWIRRTELFARFFEMYISYRMRKIATDEYLHHPFNAYAHHRAYWSEAEFNKLRPLMDKLCDEIGVFLNGKGKLVVTPYPSMRKLKPAKTKQLPKADKPAPKKAADQPVKNAGKNAGKKSSIRQIAPLGGFVLTKTGKLSTASDVVSKWVSNNVHSWKRVYVVSHLKKSNETFVEHFFLVRLKNGQYYSHNAFDIAFDLNNSMAQWNFFVHPSGEKEKLQGRRNGEDVDKYSFRNAYEALSFAQKIGKYKERPMHTKEQWERLMPQVYESEYEYAKYPSRRGVPVARYNWYEKPQKVDTSIKK